jgi:hypothetical protein
MPKRATAYTFCTALGSQATPFTFQTNPTLAAGDARISIDGGALTNLATLPTVTPANSKIVQVALSGAEMTGDNISILFSDQAGGEWQDQLIDISTQDHDIDDLAEDIYDLTHTEEGDPVSIAIPPPEGPHTCRIFKRCYNQASTAPLESVTGTARIIEHYDYDGKYHDVSLVDGVLSDPDQNGDQYLYFDVVWGARVEIEIPTMQIYKRGTVPELASVEVSAL